MKGMIITSHGPMAQGILETSKLFFGDQKQFEACCLCAEDNPDDFVNVLKEAIKRVDTGDGVVVFCDLLFGTPCNCMARVLGENFEDTSVQVIAGVNLAMILQMLAVRECNEVEMNELLSNGKDGIVDLRKALSEM